MEQRIEDWKDLRFGMFIHWGLYAIWGRGEWVMWSEAIDKDEYRELMHQFTAEKFDARAWAKTAKAAGMKYMVLTTRHHDGFSLWDSPASYEQFDAMHCAARRDFIREYVDACRAEGLKVGFYYSPLDWRFPGFFFPRMCKKSADELRKQTHEQIRELLTNYGKIDILWFDGGEDYWLCHGRDLHAWEEKGNFRERVQCPNFWRADELMKMIRELQPDIVVNNRLGMRQYGDHYTQESKIGGYDTEKPWETNHTLNGSWGYVPNPPRSLRTCMQFLMQTVTGDANFLYNVGPRADGTIPEDCVERLLEMGEELEKYGESVYGTRGGPFINDETGGMTCKGNVIYIHVWDWLDSTIRIPKLDAKILSVTSLTAKELKYTVEDGVLCFSVSREDRNAPNTVIRVELDRPAAELAADQLWRVNREKVRFGEALIVDNL
ncbi:MAG: alpha-L-fucosidase [Clostridia bacterium]|nr:alpha-L-fucosidase [Clostridia bacterium]